MATAREGKRGTAPAAGGDGLAAWAARSGRPQAGGPVRGGLRFVFCGRVPTEDRQDPVTSRVRQREQAAALARGHGQVVAEFFDTGESRTVAWGPAAARGPPRWSPSWRIRAGAGTRSWSGSMSGRSTAAGTRRWRPVRALRRPAVGAGGGRPGGLCLRA